MQTDPSVILSINKQAVTVDGWSSVRLDGLVNLIFKIKD